MDDTRDVSEAKRRRQNSTDAPETSSPPSTPPPSPKCPFLSAIQRKRLDLDLERVCAETSERQNLYLCLMCGLYLRGRGKSTPAYRHSLAEADKKSAHCLFISLTDARVYCLPENYEVIDASLADIKSNIFPSFTADDLRVYREIFRGAEPEADPRYVSRTVLGADFYPGMQGLNSIGGVTDYINVVLQSLAQITPLREWLLMRPYPEPNGAALGDRRTRLEIDCANFFKQLFNPHSLKGIILPQALVHTLSRLGGFSTTARGDPLQVLLWLLHELRTAAGQPWAQYLLAGELASEKDVYDVNLGANAVTVKKFLCLTLDLRVESRFETCSINTQAHVHQLQDLLAPYGGQAHAGIRLFLLNLPRYLLLHIKRFADSARAEKNAQLVEFPLTGLNLISCKPSRLGNLPFADMHPEHKYGGSTRYDLVASIIHTGAGKNGRYIVQTSRGGLWFEIEDLRITPIEARRVSLSQPILQLWRRSDAD